MVHKQFFFSLTNIIMQKARYPISLTDLSIPSKSSDTLTYIACLNPIHLKAYTIPTKPKGRTGNMVTHLQRPYIIETMHSYILPM